MRQDIIQSSFLSGVLSPEAAARVETAAYNEALLEGENIVPRPLGGLRRRPGLRYVDTLPNVLERITSGTATAPNGGTAANANDGSATTYLTTTTDVSTIDPFVVVRYDLGAPTSVQYADVVSFSATGGSSTEFRIQYSANDSDWTDYGAAFEQVDDTVRSYRRGSLTGVTARYWRVAKVGGTTMGAVDTTLQEFNLWQNTATVSEVRVFALEVSTEVRYVIALTDRSMTVYYNDDLYVQLPSPYESADLPELDAAQNQDSLVITHEDYAPRFVIPEFGTMYSDSVVFVSKPQYDFADSSSPTPTSEIQVVQFLTGWKQGETFQIELEGARSGAITFAGDTTADEQAATAANIAREVQKLYTVRGFEGVTCARTNTLQYTITLAGASANTYELMSATLLTAAKDVTIARSQAGVPRLEDAWSDTRGWPRTVTFFEGRLYFGGSRSLQQSLFGSKVNQILEFDSDEADDSDAIFTTLNGQQFNAFQGLFAGRSLQFFTSGGEFRYAKAPGEPITPGDAPSNQTQYGSARIRPVTIDGATLYVQRTRKALRDFRYSYEEDAYNSLGVSALAPHLLNDVVDLATWNGSRTDEIGLVFVVNGDGTLAVFSSRREQNVSAWCRWTTSGAFKAAAGAIDNVYFAVQRLIDDVPTLFLEVSDPDYYTDCAVGAPLVSSISIIGVSIAYVAAYSYTRTVETAVPHGLSQGDTVYISDMSASGSYLLNGQQQVYAVVDSTHFRVKNVTAPTGSYVSGGSFASGTDTVVSGLDHLNGQEVRVLADGFVLDNSTPAAGAITLARASTYAEVGLNFDPRVTPMPLNMLRPEGANFMRKRRVVKVRVRVLDTLGLLVNDRILPDFKFDVNQFDSPPEPVTGIKSLEETTNWDEREDKTVTFSQVDPLPMTILGIDVAMEGNS